MSSRLVYYRGAAWLVAPASTHPRARVFVWIRQGAPPRRGQTWRCLWRFR